MRTTGPSSRCSWATWCLVEAFTGPATRPANTNRGRSLEWRKLHTKNHNFRWKAAGSLESVPCLPVISAAHHGLERAGIPALLLHRALREAREMRMLLEPDDSRVGCGLGHPSRVEGSQGYSHAGREGIGIFKMHTAR